jgi:hypothetical protein
MGTTSFEAKGIYQLSDGTYNVVVNDNRPASGFTYFLKIGPAGNAMVATQFLVPGSTLGMCIEPVSDGGTIIAGENTPVNQAVPDVILIKANAIDPLGCDASFSFTTSAVTSNVSDPGYQGILIQTFQDEYYVSNDQFPITALSLCSGVGIDSPATDDFESLVYPNPASESVTIEMHGYTQNTAVLIITDITGREVRREVVAVNNARITWNRQELASGVYTFLLEDAGANRIGGGKLMLQ